jgi:hypothetical protein
MHKNVSRVPMAAELCHPFPVRLGRIPMSSFPKTPSLFTTRALTDPAHTAATNIQIMETFSTLRAGGLLVEAQLQSFLNFDTS